MNLNKIPNIDQISSYLSLLCHVLSVLSVRFRSTVLAHMIHHLKIMIFEARLHSNEVKSQKKILMEGFTSE